MKATIIKLLFCSAVFTPVYAEDFEHCHSLIEHGITDITRQQSAQHTIAYKWHSNCGIDFSSASDTNIKNASISVFGYGSGGVGSNSQYSREKLKTWCDKNKEFAESRSDLYEEARVISEPALLAWNQCQEIAKKSVDITFIPQGKHSTFVHFEIDSTLDAELRFYGVKQVNYLCEIHMTDKEGKALDLSTQPKIGHSNIQIDCERTKPEISDENGVKRLKYAEAYLSVNTSGPALPVAFPEVVEDYFVTPPGAVVAFSSDSCPSGWRDYTLAYGRFIRGIDKAATTDPSGTRPPGNQQSDSFKKHSHTRPNDVYDAGGGTNASWVAHAKNYGYGHESPPRTGFEGESSETRPKNVALLYCIKKAI
ncbi:hypothetical protein SNR37_002737 [Agarivorans aestuarii]|uniref:Phage tail collar domain-containing protein n=1 Tax=Agarivorans aestuarii TaxID=1563703 RepID=A0ABU7G1W7_9ALTE|nr:hypothetical protein [Agarivorans aestuarii]MEE1673321.1 hypothetical protein [Agarivorans aestuarii]